MTDKRKRAARLLSALVLAGLLTGAASAEDTYAPGTASGTGAIAITPPGSTGTDVTSATADYAVAIGVKGSASGAGAVVVSASTGSATGTQGVALGAYSQAAADGATAVGPSTNWDKTNKKALTTGTYSIAVGYLSNAQGANSISIGRQNEAAGKFAMAIGRQSEAAGDFAMAIAPQSEATGDNGAAFGTGAIAKGDYSTAYGSFALALGDLSTALGYGSDAHKENSTVVGGHSYACSEGASALGYQATAGTISLNDAGELEPDDRDKNSLALGANSVASRGIEIEDGNVKVYEASFGHSINDIHDSGSHLYDPSTYDPYKGEYIQYTDEVNSRLKHVDEGEADTDAANFSQLYRLNLRVGENTRAIQNLRHEVDGVGAMASALAGLHPLDFDGEQSKWQLAAAMGSYDGTQAFALGGFYHPDEDTLFSGGVSMTMEDGHKAAYNLGVTIRVGSDEEPGDAFAAEYRKLAARLSAQDETLTSQGSELAGRAQLLAERQREMEALSAQIGELKKKL